MACGYKVKMKKKFEHEYGKKKGDRIYYAYENKKKAYSFIALFSLALLLMLSFVSATIPMFYSPTVSPATNTRYVKDAVYTFTINVTNSNGTVGLNFGSANYTTTNVTQIYTALLSDIQNGTYTYHYWSYNESGASFNYSNTYDYIVADAFPVGHDTYMTIVSASAGLGLFILYIAKSLPVLLIVISIVMVIVAVGYGFRKLFENFKAR